MRYYREEYKNYNLYHLNKNLHLNKMVEMQ